MAREGDCEASGVKASVPCPNMTRGAWMRRINLYYPAAIIGNQRKAGMGEKVTGA